MEKQRVILSKDLNQSLTTAIADCPHDRLFVLTDETTRRCCLPVVEHFSCMEGAIVITIEATDQHKDLASLSHVWSELQRGGATRHSLMINLGGGMVTDLGGFAASTFKRGIQFINIPTTLLAMVDASVGGKTGINFGGLKNEIGVFNNASSVILDTTFLQTLDRENFLSGFAEMLKHGLLSDEKMWAELIREDVEVRSEQGSARRPRRPDREGTAQGPELRTYCRTRLRVIILRTVCSTLLPWGEAGGGLSYPSWLCRSLRPHR